MGMNRRIHLLAAGVVRDILFCSMSDRDLYFSRLDGRKICYELLDTFERSDGTVIIRFVQQYNDTDLIQL